VSEPYYSDEHTTLYLGDCVEVMQTLDAAAVDVVLTDPPYSSGGRRENARALRTSMLRGTSDDDWIRGDAMSTAGFTYLMRLCGMQWRRLLVPGGHVLSFIDWRMCAQLAAALETGDLRQHPTLVWDKEHFGMGAVFRNRHEFIVHFTNGSPAAPQRRDVPNVLAFPPIRRGAHPTQKPERLLTTLLSVVCPPGGLVLDPFAGSGSTLLSARKRGLRSIGVEADERYAEVIARRLADTPVDAPVGA
jgi:site-specific DNA-methyltransferase (adenine-specific)